MNIEQLEKLGELKEKGVLSEEEFQREKEKILNGQEELQKNISYNEIGQKSKLAAGLLGIFLGCFGTHNFYLGYTNKAIAQLLITLLSFGILAFASAIWGLIEGIMILTGEINVDATGKKLRE